MAQTLKDKTPPHDDELERAALGSILEDADAVVAAIGQHIKPEDFYSRANMRIFEAVISLDKKGLRPDIQTVVQELKHLGKLDEAGGASYVSSLTTIIPSSANIEYYAQMVKNFSMRRSLLRIASEIAVSAHDESKDSRQILEELQKSIFALADDRAASSRKIGEILQDTIDIIDEVRKTKNPITGVSSGFDRLDKLTTGFQNGEFIIIGARPSVGKTALALNMASNISFHKRKVPAAFFSLEMPGIALVQRLISSEARVDAQNLRSGYINTGEYDKIVNVMGKIYEAPLYIIDMPNLSLADLRTQARRHRSQQKVEIIFIDYLGLVSHDNRFIKRFEQISDISRSLKSLARELQIPVVALCQLTREAQWEVPTLAHLRDSGSIEQDADLVLFLHRPVNKKKKNDKEEEKSSASNMHPTDLIVAKQRNGPTGVVKLSMEAKFARFVPAATEHGEETEE